MGEGTRSHRMLPIRRYNSSHLCMYGAQIGVLKRYSVNEANVSCIYLAVNSCVHSPQTASRYLPTIKCRQFFSQDSVNVSYYSHFSVASCKAYHEGWWIWSSAHWDIATLWYKSNLNLTSIAVLWNRNDWPPVTSVAISLHSRWNGSLLMINSVDFWYLLHVGKQ